MLPTHRTFTPQRARCVYYLVYIDIVNVRLFKMRSKWDGEAQENEMTVARALVCMKIEFSVVRSPEFFHFILISILKHTSHTHTHRHISWMCVRVNTEQTGRSIVTACVCIIIAAHYDCIYIYAWTWTWSEVMLARLHREIKMKWREEEEEKKNNKPFHNQFFLFKRIILFVLVYTKKKWEFVQW